MEFTDSDKFWSGFGGCDPGFVLDGSGKYCYKVLPDPMTLETGNQVKLL
jgi:hypothetical protein